MRILLLFLLISPANGGFFDVLAKVVGFFNPAPSQPTKLGLSGINWINCGSGDDLAELVSLHIGPDPLSIPGNVTVALNVFLKSHIDSPLKVKLTMKKKVGLLWIKVPCMGMVGSCTYELCDILKELDHCPAALDHLGIPCSCPLTAKAGEYDVPETTFDFENVKIPSFVLDGKYKIQAKVSVGGQQVLCLDVSFTVKKQ